MFHLSLFSLFSLSEARGWEEEEGKAGDKGHVATQEYKSKRKERQRLVGHGQGQALSACYDEAGCQVGYVQVTIPDNDNK